MSEEVKRKRGRPVGTKPDKPQNPRRVQEIIYLRDGLKLTFAEIAARFNITRPGARWLYFHWKGRVKPYRLYE